MIRHLRSTTAQRWRKPVAALLISALLITQQGFQFWAAAGEIVEGRGAAGQVNIAGAGAKVEKIVLNGGLTTSDLKVGTISNVAGVELQSAGADAAKSIVPGAASAEIQTAATAIETPEGTIQPAASGPGAEIAPQAKGDDRHQVEASVKNAAGGVEAAKTSGSFFSFFGKFFDRRKAAAELAAQQRVPVIESRLGQIDPSKLTATLVRPGHAPVTVPFNDLTKAMKDADMQEAFNKTGHLRVVMANAEAGGQLRTDDDVDAIKLAVRRLGVEVADKRARNEAIFVAVKTAAPAAAAQGTLAAKAKTSVGQYVVRGAIAAAVIGVFTAFFGMTSPLGMFMLAGIVANGDRLVRESIYSVNMLRAALKESKHPGWTEVLGGLASKVIPAIINIGVFATQYHAHPVALGFAVALSLVVETFHGVWVNAWDTFQSKIGRHRGPLYQNLFNFFYGQLISGSYRLIAYFALAMAAPWTWAYWQPMILMTGIGTVCGTLGYRGLNSLYEKGRIPRKGRAGIQQARDLLMMLVGPFFSTGNMFMTWLIFFGQQSIDLAIYAIDRRTQTRPIVYVTDQKVSSSDEFHKIYLEQKSGGIKEAFGNLKYFVLLKPFFALYDWLRARGGKKQ